MRTETSDEVLRRAAQSGSGTVPHERRIRSMQCRLEGRDVTLEVGDTTTIEGQTVMAIFQIGRQGYTVHCQTTGEPNGISMFSLPRNMVYDAVDYDD